MANLCEKPTTADGRTFDEGDKVWIWGHRENHPVQLRVYFALFEDDIWHISCHEPDEQEEFEGFVGIHCPSELYSSEAACVEANPVLQALRPATAQSVSHRLPGSLPKHQKVRILRTFFSRN